MKVYYCPNCQKTTGYKRSLGWGTFFGALFTFGISLLFIPFYPKRCIICGGDVHERTSITPTQIEIENKRIEVMEIENRRRIARDSLIGVEAKDIIYCPYCNIMIRSDSAECPFCAMIVPSDIRRKINSASAMENNDYKKCPYCAEDIKREAIKCKHCGSILEGVLPLSEDKINIDNSKNLTISTTQDESLQKHIIIKNEAEVTIPKDAEIIDPLQKMDVPHEHNYKWWGKSNKMKKFYIGAAVAFAMITILGILGRSGDQYKPTPTPTPVTREDHIKVYQNKQTSLANQFENSKKAYYQAGLSVSKTDDFTEKMKRVEVRDSYVRNMRKIKTEYASLEKDIATFYGGTLPEWWHDNEKKDSDKWNFVFKLEAL